MAKPQLFIIALVVLLGVSCGQEPKGDGEWIPVPKDTSSLAKIDHFIPVTSIDQYRRAYSTLRDTITKSQPTLFLPESEAFNKPQLLEVLKNPKCVGVRIYYGIKQGKANELRCMIVGVDEQGKDLYISKTGAVAAQSGPINGGLEYGQCAPPCDGGRE